MRTPLVLLAASGLAREVMASLEQQSELEVRGILDDAPNLQSHPVGSTTVVGTLDQAGEHGDAQLLVCAGSGRSRAAIVARLRHRGIGDDRYATVVHPSAVVPSTCRIGRGSIVLARTVLTSDVVVGQHVVAMPNVTLTHDNQIDEFVTLCAGVSLGGSVHVEAWAYLGMNSSVREHTTVGAGSVLGMGAVLLRDLPAGQTWVGVPAGPYRGAPLAGLVARSTVESGSVA
jgi:sugar O-acyltransferase (sialic acid O-acetyltransferase NeuD family)